MEPCGSQSRVESCPVPVSVTPFPVFRQPSHVRNTEEGLGKKKLKAQRNITTVHSCVPLPATWYTERSNAHSLLQGKTHQREESPPHQTKPSKHQRLPPSVLHHRIKRSHELKAIIMHFPNPLNPYRSRTPTLDNSRQPRSRPRDGWPKP